MRSSSAAVKSILVICALLPGGILAKTVGYPDAPSDGYQKPDPAYPSGGDSYPDPPSDPYANAGGDSYEKDDGYGAKIKCTPYFDTVFSEYCESYTDRVCRTNHLEKCVDIPDKNCRAVVSSRQVRKCFNVTELVCKLREDIKYEVVQVGYTVQKCHKVQERVCDTVYDTAFSTKDEFQCINVANPHCTTEEYTINDQTCRTTTMFDCPTTAYEPAYGGDSYGTSSGDKYASGGDSYGSGGDSYGDDSYGGGYEQPKCKRSQTTKCYNTPRTVSVQKCGHTSEKVCEKMTERVPYAAEKQHCHNEDKKVCELEERTQPKQVKKYVYTKQCRSVPRKVCENADAKTLVPSCVASTRKSCSHSPVESCEDIPKKHCYKVGRKVKKEKCETVKDPYPAPGGYEAPAPTPSYPAPTPSYPDGEGDY